MKAGLEREKAAILVVIGALSDGTKTVLSVVMHQLQAAGVAAGPIMDQRDAFADPHLQERGIAFARRCITKMWLSGSHLYVGAPYCWWRRAGSRG